jgi:hypothetical protein
MYNQSSRFKFGNQFNTWYMAILAILLLGVGTHIMSHQEHTVTMAGNI